MGSLGANPLVWRGDFLRNFLRNFHPFSFSCLLGESFFLAFCGSLHVGFSLFLLFFVFFSILALDSEYQ